MRATCPVSSSFDLVHLKICPGLENSQEHCIHTVQRLCFSSVKGLFPNNRGMLLICAACPHQPAGEAANRTVLTSEGVIATVCATYVATVFGEGMAKTVGEDTFSRNDTRRFPYDRTGTTAQETEGAGFKKLVRTSAPDFELLQLTSPSTVDAT
jgi:hypothetical protein